MPLAETRGVIEYYEGYFDESDETDSRVSWRCEHEAH